jgi:4-amino-4-deoxychorismate lyase
MRTWVNGRRRTAIDCRDRGFQYGDGVFETMRVRGRRVRLLDFHMERLFEGCRRLGLRPPSAAALRREIAARAASHPDAVLKLIVSRGLSDRGYRPSGRERCTRVLSLHALPHAGAATGMGAVRVRMCETRIGSNPALAGIKTLNRLESVMARAEWRDAGVWEGLMRDLDGHVICGTMSNLFLRRGSTLMTPALDRCGVAGVMRRWVLERARNLRLRAWQGRFAWETINEAEEVFMTNAVAGIVSVGLIEHGKRRIRLEQSETADRLRALLERV